MQFVRIGQKLILFFCLTFSNIHCQESIKAFSLTSSGRGFHQSIIVGKDSTFVFRKTLKDSLSNRTLTSDDTLVRLKKSIIRHSLADLQNLPSPTNLRAGDGAMYSKITISTDKNVYDCGWFDSHNPNEKLKDLFLILLENIK